MILSSSNYDKGCIRDNGTMESSIISASGHRVKGGEYKPDRGGGQESDWFDTGYRSDGQSFLIDIKGKTFINHLNKPVSKVNRCRLCAKPKENEKIHFKLKNDISNNGKPRSYISAIPTDNPDNLVIDNCLCTNIRGVDGIKEENLNSNPNLNHINIREKPTAISDIKYCPQHTAQTGVDPPSCVPATGSNIAANSNWSCTNKFFYDKNQNNIYDADENILYNNLAIKYINLDYRKKDGTVKDSHYQETCYFDAGYSAMIGLFGRSGQKVPKKTYHLYSEFYLKDIERYRYRSPNNQIFPGHYLGEKIKVRYNDGYYSDNSGQYNLNFIEGIMVNESGGILTNIVKNIEALFVDDGSLEQAYKKIVGNTTFNILMKLALIFYVLFIGFGILSGTMEISRKEFFGRVLKIGLILFFASPDSWSWYNDIVVSFFMGGINLFGDLGLSMDFIPKDSYIKDVERKFVGAFVGGQASKFAFPDEMIRIFFTSENIFIKLWSLMFSPYNIASFPIIIGLYAIMLYFIFIMVKIAIFYLAAMSGAIILLSLGPIAFILTVNKLTATFFYRWLVYLGARALEITMIFLILYAFLSIFNNKIGLYGNMYPDSLLYFESCPYSLYDLYASAESGIGKVKDIPVVGDVAGFTSNITELAGAEAPVRALAEFLFSPFKVYVANPTNGISDGNGNFVGGKDFFEMLSIIFELFILLYFLNMIISQIGLIASTLITYQQQSAMVNTAIRGIAKEGSEILNTVQGALTKAVGAATPMIGKTYNLAKRSGSDLTRFAKENDKLIRHVDNVAGSTALGQKAKSLNNRLPNISGRIGKQFSDFSNAKIEAQTKKIIPAVTAKYKAEIEKGKDVTNEIKKEVIKIMSKDKGLSTNKMQSITDTLNRHFMEKDINNELNKLKEEDKLLINVEAEEKIKEKIGSKYGNNEFSKLLRKNVQKNLTDDDVFAKADRDERKIISELLVKNKLDINKKDEYDRMQKLLKDDPNYRNLKKKISQHQAHKQNVKNGSRFFENTDAELNEMLKWAKKIDKVPSMLRNLPGDTSSKVTAGLVAGSIFFPPLAPLAFIRVLYRIGEKMYDGKSTTAFLAPRAAYRITAATTAATYRKINVAANNYEKGFKEFANNRYKYLTESESKKFSDNLGKAGYVALGGIPIIFGAPVQAFIVGLKALYKYNYASSVGLDKLAREEGDNKELAKLRKLSQQGRLATTTLSDSEQKRLREILGLSDDQDLNEIDLTNLTEAQKIKLSAANFRLETKKLDDPDIGKMKYEDRPESRRNNEGVVREMIKDNLSDLIEADEKYKKIKENKDEELRADFEKRGYAEDRIQKFVEKTDEVQQAKLAYEEARKKLDYTLYQNDLKTEGDISKLPNPLYKSVFERGDEEYKYQAARELLEKENKEENEKFIDMLKKLNNEESI